MRTRHTQAEVARLLGVSLATVSHYENGERTPTHDIVLAYARLFKIPTYALFVRPEGRRPGTAVANRIREFRTRMNLTYEEVEKLTGIAAESIEGLERGEYIATHVEVIALASLFKTYTYELFIKPTGRYGDPPEEDTNVDPEAITLLSGDEGTPYDRFEGGYDSILGMAVAQ